MIVKVQLEHLSWGENKLILWISHRFFMEPNIEIQWLQRDFGIYVVNLFETHLAAKRLGFAKLSLSFLYHYCQVNADKR